MEAEERALAFECAGDTLVGVLSLPRVAATGVAVVIAVGGPQYRVGAHRQFVLLARRLAEAGHAVLRFDARGMGDSSGQFPGFEHLGPELDAAAQALRVHVPLARHLVLWGLCDAASAALLNATGSTPWSGLVLLNPWARHAETLARVEVRHYYLKRLVDPQFWRKLASGRVRLVASVTEFSGKLVTAARPGGSEASPSDYRERMAQGALGFAGPQLYICSGRDLVCSEFTTFAAGHPQLRDLWSRPVVDRVDLPDADHTFSSHVHRAAVEAATMTWLSRRFGRP